MLEGIERLILVRHAMPAMRPEIPAEGWHLDERGREAAGALAAAITEPRYCVASDEPKALETLRELAADQHVIAEPGFREVSRPYRWSDDYHQRARAYIDGTCPDGWEPRAEVVARFDSAVLRHAAAAGRRTLVIGLALTAWLASHCALEPTPSTFWACLTFPDVIDVDLVARRARRRPFQA
jgi:broad specificity phosphatase PhoE